MANDPKTGRRAEGGGPTAGSVVDQRFLERFGDRENPAYADLADLLGECLPKDRYKRMNARRILRQEVPETGPIRVLDVGCGRGRSRAWFSNRNPDADWKGLEVADSYNIEDGETLPDDIRLFDGVSIPFDAGAFDVCFTRQVFEHVRYPNELLREIHRTLAADGIFLGSVSGSEPYHYRSLFNYTALGWKTILESNGFRLERLYAGVDALSLLLNHWSATGRKIGKTGGLQILSDVLNAEGAKDEAGVRYENALKLAFAGHLVFVARRVRVS